MLSEIKTNEHFITTFFESKKWRIVRHIALIVVLYIVLEMPEEINRKTFETLGILDPEKALIEIRKVVAVMFVVCLALIYTNLFILVPKLLFKNKFATYFSYIVSLVIVKYFFELVLSENLKKFIPPDLCITNLSIKDFIASCTIAFVFLMGTSGYKIFKKWFFESRQFTALKEAKLNEELTSLKNQINPHFLFNTLNNLNTLIATNTNKASAVVLGLSDVLRFYLYEADKEKILLKKDIEILKQVLELEKIRRDNFQFSLYVESNISGLMLPPFIFTNFVENAIKHSIDNTAFSFVHITFKIEADKLIFNCENSIPSIKQSHNVGGLGIQNIKRRLELIYQNNYTLTMNEIENKYTVKLTIPIQNLS